MPELCYILKFVAILHIYVYPVTSSFTIKMGFKGP